MLISIFPISFLQKHLWEGENLSYRDNHLPEVSQLICNKPDIGI